MEIYERHFLHQFFAATFWKLVYSDCGIVKAVLFSRYFILYMISNILMDVPNRTERKKVLFCYVDFHHYRVPIWQELAKQYDVTVLHASAPQTDGSEFREISVPPWKWWRFRYQPGLLREVRSGDYDAVIFLFDVAWISSLLGFFFCPARSRRITWGFWMTGSGLANRARVWFAKRADGNVFYAAGAARDFLKAGVSCRKIWIARNTVLVDPAERAKTPQRDTLLFLGSFNTRKGNDVAIAAFDAACEQIPDHISFVLVGDGPAKAAAEAQAAALPNAHRIKFHPGTLDDDKVRAYYAKALASISFGQAGLSVLHSFGHGVPFVTKQGAISGGESENIITGQTGVVCSPSREGLRDVLVKLCVETDYADTLGCEALGYYSTKASVQAMTAGFAGAVEGSHLSTEKIL